MDRLEKGEMKSRKESFFLDLRRAINLRLFQTNRALPTEEVPSVVNPADLSQLLPVFLELGEKQDDYLRNPSLTLACLKQIEDGLGSASSIDIDQLLFQIIDERVFSTFLDLFRNQKEIMVSESRSQNSSEITNEVVERFLNIFCYFFQDSTEIFDSSSLTSLITDLSDLLISFNWSVVNGAMLALSSILFTNPETFTAILNAEVLKKADVAIQKSYEEETEAFSTIVAAFVKLVCTILENEPFIHPEEYSDHFESFFKLKIQREDLIDPVEAEVILCLASFINKKSEEECFWILKSETFPIFFQRICRSAISKEDILASTVYLAANLSALSSDEFLQFFVISEFFDLVKLGLKSSYSKVCSDVCVVLSNLSFSDTEYIKRVLGDCELVENILGLLSKSQNRLFSDLLQMIWSMLGEGQLEEVKSFLHSHPEIVDTLIERSDFLCSSEDLQKSLKILHRIFVLGEEFDPEIETEVNIFTKRVQMNQRLADKLEALQEHRSPAVKILTFDLIRDFFELE